MATLEAAELARTQRADELRGLGAHALEVAQLGPSATSDFGVVAYFRSKPREPVPSTIEVTHRRRKQIVPVRVKIGRPFKPEAQLE